MRISIGVPGISINFDEGQIKLFLKEKTNEGCSTNTLFLW